MNCDECSLGRHAYCTGCECPNPIHKPVLLPGWYHTTRSKVAHCFDLNGYPICQDSDVGERINRGRYEQVIGELHETCRRILVTRIRAHINRRRRAR